MFALLATAGCSSTVAPVAAPSSSIEADEGGGAEAPPFTAVLGRSYHDVNAVPWSTLAYTCPPTLAECSPRFVEVVYADLDGSGAQDEAVVVLEVLDDEPVDGLEDHVRAEFPRAPRWQRPRVIAYGLRDGEVQPLGELVPRTNLESLYTLSLVDLVAADAGVTATWDVALYGDCEDQCGGPDEGRLEQGYTIRSLTPL